MIDWAVEEGTEVLVLLLLLKKAEPVTLPIGPQLKLFSVPVVFCFSTAYSSVLKIWLVARDTGSADFCSWVLPWLAANV